jgi:hypothetical protein
VRKQARNQHPTTPTYGVWWGKESLSPLGGKFSPARNDDFDGATGALLSFLRFGLTLSVLADLVALSSFRSKSYPSSGLGPRGST